jgi:BASS family bile acid:Na+ symporter
LSRIGNALLVVVAVPLLLFAIRPVMSLIGHGEVLAMIALSVVAVAVGHWLGGPDLGERSTLAMDTASRHPGLALAIAAANFPEQRRLVAAAIVLYLIVSTLVLLPYDAWCKRRLARALETPGPQQKAA